MHGSMAFISLHKEEMPQTEFENSVDAIKAVYQILPLTPTQQLPDAGDDGGDDGEGPDLGAGNEVLSWTWVDVEDDGTPSYQYNPVGDATITYEPTDPPV